MLHGCIISIHQLGQDHVVSVWQHGARPATTRRHSWHDSGTKRQDSMLGCYHLARPQCGTMGECTRQSIDKTEGEQEELVHPQSRTHCVHHDCAHCGLCALSSISIITCTVCSRGTSQSSCGMVLTATDAPWLTAPHWHDYTTVAVSTAHWSKTLQIPEEWLCGHVHCMKQKTGLVHSRSECWMRLVPMALPSFKNTFQTQTMLSR